MLPFAETLSFDLNSVFIRESHHFRFLSFDTLQYITCFTSFHQTSGWISLMRFLPIPRSSYPEAGILLFRSETHLYKSKTRHRKSDYPSV